MNNEDLHDDLLDWAIIGASRMAHGVTDFKNWSRAMLAEEHSESIRPFLPAIFDNSKKILERTENIFEVAEERRQKIATRQSEPLPPPYEQFTEGMRQRTATCHFLIEPSKFLTVPQKKKFAVLVMLHTFAPFAFVPLWALHERNWWLLLGVPSALFGLLLGSRASVQGPKATSGGFLPFLVIALFFVEGWRGRDFFYTFCATWSWGWYLIAEDAQKHWAEETLVSSRNAYERAIAEQKIVVVFKSA